MNKGLLIVISGPAGSGKGTVNSHLLKTGDFVYSVSATTRPARPGEVNGQNYYFISREEFEERINSDAMLEYTEYCENLYGTPKKECEEVLEKGKNLLLEIEVEGARQVKEKYPDALLIMLLPPSFKIQETRLRSRATESEEKILARLEKAKTEINHTNIYDYVVYNHDFQDLKAADEILAIVKAEKCSLRRNPFSVRDYFSKE